jgi:hypothetical protein
MPILYILLSAILYLILAPLGIIYGLISKPKETGNKLIGLAESIDRTGNVICAELFNKLLLRNSENHFGDGRETISSVIGRNVLAGTLSPLGRIINKLLDMVQKGHSVRNIGY